MRAPGPTARRNQWRYPGLLLGEGPRTGATAAKCLRAGLRVGKHRFQHLRDPAGPLVVKKVAWPVALSRVGAWRSGSAAKRRAYGTAPLVAKCFPGLVARSVASLAVGGKGRAQKRGAGPAAGGRPADGCGGIEHGKAQPTRTYLTALCQVPRNAFHYHAGLPQIGIAAIHGEVHEF